MNKNLITYTALSATMLFWGLSFIGTKIALNSFTPFVLVFLRLGLASCVFIIILFRNGKPSLSVEQHKKLILLALFEPGLYFTFETLGLTYTTASKASIILALVPIAVMILARLILGEEIKQKNLIGIVLSMIGIVILVLGGSGFSLSMGGSILGDILIFGAVFSAAFYMVLARDLAKTLSAVEITSFQIIYGTIMFLPMFLYNLPGIDWGEISMQSITAVVFLSLFCTVAGFLFYNFALTRIEASRASVFINGIPVITAIGAWFILHETLSAVQMAGGVMVLLAVLISNLQSTSKSEQSMKKTAVVE